AALSHKIVPSSTTHFSAPLFFHPVRSLPLKSATQPLPSGPCDPVGLVANTALTRSKLKNDMADLEYLSTTFRRGKGITERRTRATHQGSLLGRAPPARVDAAPRVPFRVCSRDSRGMLVTKGRISQPRPVGISRVREIDSHSTYTPPSRSTYPQ